MKRAAVFFGVLAAASLAMAGEGVSPGKGKELFRGTQLGTTGRSCDGCHPGGKGLEEAAAYDEARLAGIINRCIEGPLGGKALDPSSDEMKSLVAYVKGVAGKRR